MGQIAISVRMGNPSLSSLILLLSIVELDLQFLTYSLKALRSTKRNDHGFSWLPSRTMKVSLIWFLRANGSGADGLQ